MSEEPVGEKYAVGDSKNTYIFDIIKEADFLTATCPELQIIISAPDWVSLEDKIHNAYMKYELEKEHG